MARESMTQGELMILSGNAHPALAEAVAAQLGVGLVDAVVGHFPDGETQVKIANNVRDQDVFVIQPTGPPANQNIMETLIIIDALRRASAGRITAVIPYFGYARQDRKDASRVPISAKLVADLFETAGVDRLLAVDLHSAQTQGFSNLPFDHLYARNALLDRVKREVNDPLVVAPDVGATKMVNGYAERLGADLSIVVKDRVDGRTTKVAAVIGPSVMGRNVLLVDDMVTTAGSLLKAAEALKEQGAARVVAAATHGVLCGEAVERIEASPDLDHLFVTDTLPEHTPSAKITRVTIAPLLAQAISKIHNGESVSELF
jgi:ribose-phosphate pyrophosphokinase